MDRNSISLAFTITALMVCLLIPGGSSTGVQQPVDQTPQLTDLDATSKSSIRRVNDPNDENDNYLPKEMEGLKMNAANRRALAELLRESGQQSAQELESDTSLQYQQRQQQQQQQQQQLRIQMLKQRQEKQKAALKKKWHKLVDDAIDDEFLGQPNERSTKAHVPRVQKGGKRENFRRKKWLQPNGEDGDGLVIIMKKPLSGEPSDEQQSIGAGAGDEQTRLVSPIKSHDSSDIWDKLASRMENNISRGQQPAVNLEQHRQNILSDSFNIRKGSTFSTNNKLGFKGVPSALSDEQF